jgi:hypothetical protein
MGAPLPVRHRHPTPDLMPSPPRMPPATPCAMQGTQFSKNNNLPAANADSHVPPPKTQPVDPDSLAEDSIQDENFSPELQIVERTSFA